MKREAKYEIRLARYASLYYFALLFDAVRAGIIIRSVMRNEFVLTYWGLVCLERRDYGTDI